MVKVYYEGTYGEVIDFTSENYKMHKSTNLLSYKWDYQNNEYVDRIESFSMKFAPRNFVVTVRAKNRTEYEKALKKINDTFERDIRLVSPGKLYIGDCYLRCYIVESGLEVFDWHKNQVVKPYKLIAEDGQWIKENTSFRDQNVNTYAEGSENLDYPHDFAFDYASDTVTRSIVNTSIADADFLLTIHGPCANPRITIGGHAYEVNTSLAAGEYLTVNSITKKILKTKVSGEKINCFAFRNRESYIFQKVPTGAQVVFQNGSFELDITLFEYRSEPEWWI